MLEAHDRAWFNTAQRSHATESAAAFESVGLLAFERSETALGKEAQHDATSDATGILEVDVTGS